MTTSSNPQAAQAQALITQIQAKQRKLADEFAAGEINREQFYKIYEHYQHQLNLASAMLAEADLPQMQTMSAGETIAIRKKLTPMATAAAVYLHESGEILERIGDFNISLETLKSTLSGIIQQVKDTLEAEAQTMAVGADWVLFMPGRYSTAIMVFSHEPVMRQIAIVENMHRDFETANYAALASGQTHAAKLVFPFMTFVRRSVARK